MIAHGVRRLVVALVLTAIVWVSPAPGHVGPPVVRAACGYEGRLWTFTEAQEIYRADLEQKRNTLVPGGERLGLVYDAIVLSGKLWLLTNRGLAVSTGDDSDPFAFALGPWDERGGGHFAGRRIRDAIRLTEAGGRLYLYGFNTVYRYDPAADEFEQILVSRDNLATVSVANYVWFGTRSGFYRWTEGMTEPEEVTPSACGLPAPFGVLTSGVGEDALSVGTEGDGLLRFDLGTGAWTVAAAEPVIFRLLPLPERAGGPGVAAWLPPSRLAIWREASGWSDALAIRAKQLKFVSVGERVVACELNGNGLWVWDGTGWQEEWLGREQVFYRGVGAVAPPPGRSRPDRFAVWSRRAALGLLGLGALVAAGALLWRGRDWLADRVRPRAEPEPEPELEFAPAWLAPAGPPVVLSAIAEHRRAIAETVELSSRLGAEREAIQAELASLPPETRDRPETREKYGARTELLKRQLAERSHLVFAWRDTVAAEIAGLEREWLNFNDDLARLEQDHRERRLDAREYSSWRRLLRRRRGDRARELALRKELLAGINELLQ